MKMHAFATLAYAQTETVRYKQVQPVRIRWSADSSPSTQENLYAHLGPEKAPYATPIMVEGGAVEWHSFLGQDKGRAGKSLRRSSSS